MVDTIFSRNPFQISSGRNNDNKGEKNVSTRFQMIANA